MSDKKLNTTRKEFQDSYTEHYKLYKNTDSNLSPKTRRLILFYAVECGLKSLLLKQIGCDTYNDLVVYCSTNPDKKVAGHDIKALIKEVNPRNEYVLKDIHLHDGNRTVRPRQFNELWRYGPAVANPEEEENAEKVLGKIAEWIKNR